MSYKTNWLKVGLSAAAGILSFKGAARHGLWVPAAVVVGLTVVYITFVGGLKETPSE